MPEPNSNTNKAECQCGHELRRHDIYANTCADCDCKAWNPTPNKAEPDCNRCWHSYAIHSRKYGCVDCLCHQYQYATPPADTPKPEQRKHVFSGSTVAAQGGLDENGIPEVAHSNTKGDTPVSARHLDEQDAWEVAYEPDSPAAELSRSAYEQWETTGLAIAAGAPQPEPTAESAELDEYIHNAISAIPAGRAHEQAFVNVQALIASAKASGRREGAEQTIADFEQCRTVQEIDELAAIKRRQLTEGATK